AAPCASTCPGDPIQHPLQLYPSRKVGTIHLMPERAEWLRALPSVDRVLHAPAASEALARFHRSYVIAAIRSVLDDLRRRLGGDPLAAPPSAEEVMTAALARMTAAQPLALRRVVNASGVVLHTNLGRAVLAAEAVAAVEDAAANAVNLEYDLERGDRGDRDALINEDLCALTGAEDATVVNNNAAAV